MTKRWKVPITACLAALLSLLAPAPVARADIYQWQYINPANPGEGKQPSTMLCPGGAGAYAAPGADLSNRNLTMAYLIGANLYPEMSFDFEGNVIDYRVTDLTGANLSGADARGASFWAATLTGANFTDAYVQGADFGLCQITKTQLYSTASYQAHDLSGTRLSGDFADMNLAGQNLTKVTFYIATLSGANLSRANATNADFSTYSTGSSNLTGANLSLANLTNVNFSGFEGENGYIWGANLTDANLSGADARGANFYLASLTGANTSNLIQSDGHIAGLDLTAGASLVIRDYDGNPAANPPTGPLPIIVDQRLAMDSIGTLRLVFDADAWDSLISFAPGIPVTLGGTLELSFAPDVNLASQLGRTIDLFDWIGVTPTGAFTVSSPYSWDLAKLYTTGEITLLPTADFNGDNAVNDADLGAWKTGFGISTNATHAQGDADGDHDADGADFLAWQRQLGMTSPGTRLASVPEPAACVMLLVGALVMSCRRRTAAS